VCEGAIKYWTARQPATDLVPIAQGFNKVLFQKQPAGVDLNRAFDDAFPEIPHKTITMWERPVYAFSSLAAFIDVAGSTPRALLPRTSVTLNAMLVPGASLITAEGGATIHVPVRVVNRSLIPFGVDADAPFGLSYHVFSDGGRHVQFDNIRSYFTQPLEPNEERVVDLAVEVPRNRGDYTLELDIVWEGVAWLKNRGLDTAHIDLRVI